jgi:hypothetical protein
VRNVFLSAIPLDNANADGYLDAIKIIRNYGFLNSLSSCKLISTDIDGAASMIGAENGLT